MTTSQAHLLLLILMIFAGCAVLVFLGGVAALVALPPVLYALARLIAASSRHSNL